MKKKENYICTDLKNRFQFIELEAEKIFQQGDFNKNNHLIFLISGEIQVIYGSLYPRVISGGNMFFLTPLPNCICKVLSPANVIILGFDGSIHGCDKFLFQGLSPIFTLLKYEFREVEIRRPLDAFLDLMKYYLKGNMPPVLHTEKIKEFFILLKAYYDPEELAMLFYPLLGKNMEFKKTVTDNYLRVKNTREYADLCGYSLGVFQSKFKNVFGETVYQWMQRQKAEQIKHRLMTTDMNLRELAEELGFDSPAHLNKFCKIWFGMTPSEVRKTFLLKKNLR